MGGRFAIAGGHPGKVCRHGRGTPGQSLIVAQFIEQESYLLGIGPGLIARPETVQESPQGSFSGGEGVAGTGPRQEKIGQSGGGFSGCQVSQSPRQR